MSNELTISSNAIVPVDTVNSEHILYLLKSKSKEEFWKGEAWINVFRPQISFVMQKAFATPNFDPNLLARLVTAQDIPERFRPTLTLMQIKKIVPSNKVNMAKKLRERIDKCNDFRKQQKLTTLFFNNQYHLFWYYEVYEYRFKHPLISLLEQKQLHIQSQLFMKGYTQEKGIDYKEYINKMLRQCCEQIGDYDAYLSEKKRAKQEYMKEYKRRKQNGNINKK